LLIIYILFYIYFKGYWLAYKDGVYDVSSFVENHPGGKQILKTAGKALESCWKIFTIHQIDHVYEILEEYRIGNLPPGIIKCFFFL
jgi:sulfite oxidase